MTASGTDARGSATRQLLLDATVQVMLEEGYAAATSRKVAARAGVRPALVHYYFPTMDDLYIAVFRQGAEASLARQQHAMASDRPLTAMWQSASDSRGNRLLLEFMALANHRKEIRAEIAAWAGRWRDEQVQALGVLMHQHAGADGGNTGLLTPSAVSVLIACIGRGLVLEDAVGITNGHHDALALVTDYLQRFDSSLQDGSN